MDGGEKRFTQAAEDEVDTIEGGAFQETEAEDFLRADDLKLRAYWDTLSIEQRQQLVELNRKLHASGSKAKPAGRGAPSSDLEGASGGRPDRFQGGHLAAISAASRQLERHLTNKHGGAAKEREAALKKVERGVEAEAERAIQGARGHIEDTFAELNRRLMAFRPPSTPDGTLELFEAEKRALVESLREQAQQLALTGRGEKIGRLRELQEKYNKKGGKQWTTADIDAFVVEYLEIYSGFVSPSVHTEELRQLLAQPR